MSILSVNNLTAGYHKNIVLKDINFDIESGRIVGILGSNGSGKTTLLKAVSGLIPHSGKCCIYGNDVSEMTHKKLANYCGYIPQESGISIDLSIMDVVMMGYNPKLKLLEAPSDNMRKNAQNLLSQVGLLSSYHPEINTYSSFSELSEGQKQLCILARTLVCDKSLLLMDEPESALDFNMRYQVLNLIRKYTQSHDACALITLHDASLALNYCDDLLLLNDHKLIGQINPGETTIEQMETLLSRIYGPVSLHHVTGNDGRNNLVMLKEAIRS